MDRGAASAPPPRAPIEARLAAAGLPSLRRTAWLEIDLDAIRSNLAAIRAAVGPGVRVEPVVKADAYGHGAVEVCRVLEAAGADGLGVATLDEAVELREAGVSLPILVLYPVPPWSVAEARRLGIALAAAGGEALDTLLAAARAADLGAPADPPLEIHLEVETGLGRGGSLAATAAADAAAIRATRGVRLAGVWTHLAAADDPVSPGAQDAAFTDALAGIEARVGRNPGTRRHLAASGAILGAAVGRWDAVRPGLAVFGLVPDGLVAPSATARVADALRPALALLARPVRVAELPAGHGVGYGPAFTTPRRARIATLPLGYADGWHRVLTNRADALVRGVRAPIVGRVSMDGITVDVTDVPGPPVGLDDEFVLIGAQGDARIEAAEVARAGTTISYEVVAAMARRLSRVYHAAGNPVGVRSLADREG